MGSYYNYKSLFSSIVEDVESISMLEGEATDSGFKSSIIAGFLAIYSKILVILLKTLIKKATTIIIILR